MEVDAITARECLMGAIVDQINRRGYYFAELASNPPQALVDLRWAAQMAGRMLGCRTETYARAVEERVPMKITVVIAPVDPRREGSGLDARVRSMIENLLLLGVADHAARKSA